jgi:hypothetical protein
MKKRSLLIGLIVTVFTVTLVGKVIASGSFNSYNMTVPKIGGSNTTNNVTKASSSDNAVICSSQVGGGYTLNARVDLLNGSSASSSQTISNNQRREYVLIPSTAGSSYHARLSTGVLTLVDVQATGRWSPDNPGGCGF